MQDYPSQQVVFDLLIAIGFTLACGWLVAATTYRLCQWARTPLPLPIPLTPAPRTRAGVAGRLFLELILFRSLARANRTTWFASLLFHYALLFLLLMHLRFVFVQMPFFLLPFIRYSGWAFLALMLGLLILLARRVLIDRLRYISAPSDYLHIILIMVIGLSGASVKRLWPVDLYEVGQFVRGALSFQWQPLPEGGALVIHILLVMLLMLIFPISKLMHGLGVLFSPTFNQPDNASVINEKPSSNSQSLSDT